MIRFSGIRTYARNLIYHDDGLFEHRSYLKANDGYSNQVLSNALRVGAKAQHSSTISINRQAKSALSLTILPTRYKRSFLGFEQMAVVIFITDPDDREISNTQYLESRWHLAPVEVKFASNLLKGLSSQQNG